MANSKFYQAIERVQVFSAFLFLSKWLFISACIGLLVGSSSALFLILLDWVTDYREAHLWIIALLPLAGFAVGAVYHYLGKGVESGNNLLIDKLHGNSDIVPIKMAPLVLFGTLITHLFGGSAGREGTAVQMGGAIADQFTKFFKFSDLDRKLLIIAGISAGFASVFGTPLAGAVFALEVYVVGNIRYDAILPSLLAAILADFVTTHVWNVGHTHFQIDLIPTLGFANLCYAILAGICFGLVAMAFSKSSHFFATEFKKYISYSPLRPLVGGIVLVIVFGLIYYFLGTTKYTGLGVPTIIESFSHPMASYDFAFKLLLTAFTLGCGFKGGEVTPLFFIGATLGSFLSVFLPLPTGLLAGMGFVAVFAGAANTPLACIMMGIELFGSQSIVYIGLACVVAYLFSGKMGIYSAQIIGQTKN